MVDETEQATEIRRLMDEAATLSRANGPSKAVGARVSEMQKAAAQRFGQRYGWRRSRTEFSLVCLAKGAMHDGASGYRTRTGCGDHHDEFDHPYFYRCDRRAAAIAAHLYNWPANDAACRRIAAEYSLNFEVVTDFPSWWNPGGTTLVLWTPASSRTGK